MKARLAGLADAPCPGKPRTYGEDPDRRILALLDRPPVEGFARWTALLLAKELGDVSDQYIWRFLRAQSALIVLEGPRAGRSASSAPSTRSAKPSTIRGATSSSPTPRKRSSRRAPAKHVEVAAGGGPRRLSLNLSPF